MATEWAGIKAGPSKATQIQKEFLKLAVFRPGFFHLVYSFFNVSHIRRLQRKKPKSLPGVLSQELNMFIVYKDCILRVSVMFIFDCCWSSQKEWNCSYPSGLRLFSIFVVGFYFDLYKYEIDCPSNWTFLTPNTSKLCHLRTSLACSCCPQIVPPSPTSDFLVLGKKRWALNEPWRSVDSGCFICRGSEFQSCEALTAKCKDVRIGRELTKDTVQPLHPTTGRW